jgi:Fe2+ or Zn2+ uptake regulation protein
MSMSGTVQGRSKVVRKRARTFPGAVLDDLAFKAIGASEAPLSAYAIAERVAGLGRGPSKVAAVYRSLDRLCAQGVVERVETLSAYRLRDQANSLLLVHADHQTTTSLPIGPLYDSLKMRVLDAGFKLERLVLEAIVTDPDSGTSG